MAFGEEGKRSTGRHIMFEGVRTLLVPIIPPESMHGIGGEHKAHGYQETPLDSSAKSGGAIKFPNEEGSTESRNSQKHVAYWPATIENDYSGPAPAHC